MKYEVSSISILEEMGENRITHGDLVFGHCLHIMYVCMYDMRFFYQYKQYKPLLTLTQQFHQTPPTPLKLLLLPLPPTHMPLTP